MSLTVIILLIVLILLFSGGGFYAAARRLRDWRPAAADPDPVATLRREVVMLKRFFCWIGLHAFETVGYSAMGLTEYVRCVRCGKQGRIELRMWG